MKFPYGTVYKVQREFTLKDIFKQLEDIKNLGMNYVVIWPSFFWWEDEGNSNYPFNTGMEILEFAEKIGLKIIFELAGQLTSLEYMPDFLMKDEYLVMDIHSHNTEFRDGYCPLNFNHPEVKTIIREKFMSACQKYKDYPALYGYDIWNETQLTSFDPYTLDLFRQWLKEKYKSIDTLNSSWDRVYKSWEQVKFTRWLWASVMPYVDYQEFKKENIGIILDEWREIVKGVDPNHPVIADNIGSMIAWDCNYSRPQDDWNVANHVDEFGISFYPKYLPPTEPYSRWQTLAGAYSATRSGRFWISELQSHHATMFLPGSLVYPHEIKLWNWEAISHGAKGVIYWKWNPFMKGYQTSGRGLVNNRGEYTQRAYEASAICRIISNYDKEFVEYKPVTPKVAILYDRMSHEFSKAFSEESNSLYVDSLAGLYKCLWENNIPARYFTPEQIQECKFINYKALFITEQINISDELADKLKEYVNSGGVLIYDGKFGEINNTGILNREIPGGKLNNILGYYMEDIDIVDMDINLCLGSQESLLLKGYFEKRNFIITGSDVDILGSFSDGRPAVLRVKYGNGQIIGIGTHLWYGYIKNECVNAPDFIKRFNDMYNISPYSTSNNILKISMTAGEDGIILFVFNYTDKEVSETVLLNCMEEGVYTILDLHTEKQYKKNACSNELFIDVSVKGYDVLLLKLKKCGA